VNSDSSRTIAFSAKSTSRRGRLGTGSRSQFSALEARTLYSADLGLAGSLPATDGASALPAEVGPPGARQSADTARNATLTDKAQSNEGLTPASDRDTFTDLLKLGSGDGTASKAIALEVVLIDSQVSDIEALRADFRQQIAQGRNLAVIVIDSQTDGVLRATQMLALAGQPVSALHIISHGESGVLTLGSSRIDSQTIETLSSELATWGRYLSNDADVLLYGCDLAADLMGETMLTRLGEITGADIAASRDLTGASKLGGDWDLEYRSGRIEASVIATTDLQEHWQNILAANTSGLLPVNAATVGPQLLAPFQENGRNVSVNNHGDIAVTWLDVSAQSVMVRLFHPNGSARTGDISVAVQGAIDPGQLWQFQPVVAMREDGGFVVSWIEKHATAGNDKLWAQRFTAEGLSLGQAVDVTGGQSYDAIQRPDIDVDANGDFFIVYEGYDGTKNHVHVSGFDPFGNSLFTDRLVGRAASLFDGEASIAVKPDDGTFVVSWTFQEPILGGIGVGAQRFDASGNVLTTNGAATLSPWSNVLLVNSSIVGLQYQSSIAIADDGRFTVSYISEVYSGATLVGTNVFMHQFNADDSAAGSAVNIASGGPRPWNSFSSVAVDANNNPVIVWQQSSQSLSDGFADAKIMAYSPSGTFGYSSGTVGLANVAGTTYTMPRVATNGNIIVTDFTKILTSNYTYLPSGGGFTYTTTAAPGAPVQDLVMVVRQSNTADYFAIAPTIAVPSDQIILEDSAGLAFTLASGRAIQIGDSDAGSNSLHVTVTVPAGSGQLEIANPTMAINPLTPGLNFTGAISGATLQLEGTVAQLNQALAQLVYRPAINFNGSLALSVNTTERYGAPSLSATGQINISVTAVSDAPVGTNQSGVLLEDSSHIFVLSDFGFSDSADSPTNNFSGVKITTLPLSGSLTLSGSPVLVNQVLTSTQIASGNLVYASAPNASGANYASLGFKVMDDGGTANGGSNIDSTARSFTFNVTAVNDAPAGSNQSRTILEDSSFTFGTTDFGFTDATDSPTNALAGIKIISLPGAGSLTLAGAPVALNQVVSTAQLLAGSLVYTPVANASGASYASLGFRVVDSGGTANGGIDIDPVARSFSFDVSPRPDAPILVLGSITITEGSTTIITPSMILASDADNPPASSLVFTVNSISDGQFEFISAPGTSIYSFTQQDINLGLVSFVHYGSDFAPSYTLSVSDGTTMSPTQAAVINFIGVNDAPVISSAQASITVNEDTLKLFNLANGNLIAIGDSDANASIIQLSLSAPNSSISLASLTGITVTGGANNSSALIAQGTLADLNLALSGLGLRPNANFNGTSALTIAVDDLGGSGIGGARQSSLVLPITVVSVDDAPEGTSLRRTLAENSSLVLGQADFGFTDPLDLPGNTFIGLVFNTLPTQGSLTLSGVAVTTGLFIPVSRIDAGDLIFTPAANGNGLNYASARFIVIDSGNPANGGATIDTSENILSFDITSVNSAPTIALLRPSESIDEDSSLVFSSLTGNAIVLNDLDAGASVVELTLSVQQGALSLGSQTGIVITSGADHSSSMVLRGSVADLNLGLNGLTLTPPANFNGAITLNAMLDDLGNSGPGGALKATASIGVTVNAVNDAPIILAPPLVSGAEDTAFVFSTGQKTNQLSIADPDGNVMMEITLNATHGALSLNGASGLSYSLGDGSNDSQLRFSGRASDIGSALDGLRFDPDSNFTGDAILTINANDGGNIGSGGAKIAASTITLRIQPANDLPIVQNSSAISTLTGSTSLIGPDKLLTVDLESGAQNIVYTLESDLTQSELLLNGRVLSRGDTFTQEDVNRGSITLRALASSTGSDSLQLSVKDQDGGSAPAIRMSIDIKPRSATAGVAPTGSVGTATTGSTSNTADATVKGDAKVVVDPASVAQGSLPSAPSIPVAVPEGAAVADKQTGRSANSAANTAANPVSSIASDVNRQEASRLPEQSPSSLLPIAQLGNLNPLQASGPSEITKPADGQDPVNILPTGISLPNQALSLEKIIADNGFQKSLEQVRDDVMQVASIDRNVMASTIGVSASFTIGYVLWLVRGGVLISSLLASLPAWRMVDPLPVLGSLANGKRDNEDDKSLEELVAHQ
jgi:hypothetical protein